MTRTSSSTPSAPPVGLTIRRATLADATLIASLGAETCDGCRGTAVFSMTDLQRTVRPSSLCGVPWPARPGRAGLVSAARSRGEFTTHSYTTVYTPFGHGFNTNSTALASGRPRRHAPSGPGPRKRATRRPFFRQTPSGAGSGGVCYSGQRPSSSLCRPGQRSTWPRRMPVAPPPEILRGLSPVPPKET